MGTDSCVLVFVNGDQKRVPAIPRPARRGWSPSEEMPCSPAVALKHWYSRSLMICRYGSC